MILIRRMLVALGLLFLAIQSNAQQSKVTVFLDCPSGNCFQTYIRQQLKAVDFVRDQFLCDVQAIVLSQPTGSGGSKVSIQFVGQGNFAGRKDTVFYFTEPMATENELRDALHKHLMIGLVPYLIDKGWTSQISISMNNPTSEETDSTLNDPFNYWVFYTNANGWGSGDKNYTSRSINGSFSAERTTDKMRASLGFSANEDRNTYRYETDKGPVNVLAVFRNNSIWANYVHSVTPHFSWATYGEWFQSTFFNLKYKLDFRPGIEYNFFPYKSAQTKFLTFRYQAFVTPRQYIDSTIYDKINETLFGQSAGIYASFVQPWGSISSNVVWNNFMHDFSKNSLSCGLNLRVRIVKGLSMNLNGYYSTQHNQLFLPKGDATGEEVLLRIRALASSYSYWASFGITYRFGSKYNNFVNMRFTDGG